MPSNEPQYVFKASLQTGSGPASVDLNSGGGQDPAVIAYNTIAGNQNQVWEFYSVPGFETRVVIKNAGKKYILFADGEGRKVRCDGSVNVWDAAAQWYLEGGEVSNIAEGTVIRLRSVKFANNYLDLTAGNTANGTAFLVYPGHGGANQSFKVARR